MLCFLIEYIRNYLCVCMFNMGLEKDKNHRLILVEIGYKNF